LQRKVINLLAGEQQNDDDFGRVNPLRTVPVLIDDDDDFIVTESRAICSYLVDAKSPNHTLYPLDDAKARCIIDQRMFYDATTFSPAIIAALVSNEIKKLSMHV
jgi:glutathione S-transferase